MTAPAMLLSPHNLAMQHFQPSSQPAGNPVKGFSLPLMEDGNTRMEITNLHVAFRALVDLWNKQQRKLWAVPLPIPS